jgi:DNA-binding NtrC family response regulator
MPVAMQAKLLRVLEDFKFRRLGGRAELTADVRVIAATNRDPQKAIREGKLREDLYYRLNVFGIHLPPLRERREDIPPIVEALIYNLNQKHDTRVAGAGESFLACLQSRQWEGNVRELRNVVERAVILAGHGHLTEQHVPVQARQEVQPDLPESRAGRDPMEVRLRVGASVDEAEQVLIEATLRHTGNNKTRAASILGITTKTLHVKLKQYRIVAQNQDAESSEEVEETPA